MASTSSNSRRHAFDRRRCWFSVGLFLQTLMLSTLVSSIHAFTSHPSPALVGTPGMKLNTGWNVRKAPQFRRDSQNSIVRRWVHVSEQDGKDDALATRSTGVTLDSDGNAALTEENYSYRNAIYRTLFWVGAAALFGAGLITYVGPEIGEEFFAGYLVEQSLSVDNLLVFLLLFEYFKVPLKSQDRVLNWGIYGAIVMRAIMIGLGTAALQSVHEILLVFAGILVYSSAKFFVDDGDDEDEDPENNAIVRFSRNLFPSSDDFDGDRFFTTSPETGLRLATPLFVCLLAVEISDIVFAVDSIPAVFGVTENPLVVFSSNIFAIMGLRSLYTILSKAATDLEYLEPAVALVLGFIGSKMVAEYFGYIVPTNTALALVATLLGGGIGLSLWEKQRDTDDTVEKDNN